MRLVASSLRRRLRHMRRHPAHVHRICSNVLDPHPDEAPELRVTLVGFYRPLPSHVPPVVDNFTIRYDVDTGSHEAQRH
eukprot:3165251-Pyramimonas_sp.AAC.1